MQLKMTETPKPKVASLGSLGAKNDEAWAELPIGISHYGLSIEEK